MRSLLTKDQVRLLGLALVFAMFFALSLSGVAQIISIYGWCEYDAERQLGGPTTRNATLQLDSTPAIVCTNTPEPIEIPIAPLLLIVGFAGVGAVVSLYPTISLRRRLRLAERDRIARARRAATSAAEEGSD
jgi:hypothetical protein